MASSVETICETLTRHRLIPADQMQSLSQEWAQQGGTTSGADFTRWLVSQQHLTPYQAGVVGRGHADQLILGPYRLLDRIGAGRMAGVFKGVHELGQVVAIKVLPPSKAKDSQILARFQREARLALRLKHPNVVRTFHMGETRSLHYLVMECLEGETLEEVLQRRGYFLPGEAVRVVHQALMGLQHLHEQGVIHRDLNPGNLMIVGGSEASTLQGTMKLLDIGTGKELFDESRSGSGFELTNEGDMLGTAEYMSPEQARDPRCADIRSDLYSLGCVLYHVLAGQPPFDEKNRVRLLVRHATEQPVPVKELNAAVPAGLQDILNVLLDKNPDEIFLVPSQAAQALEMFVAKGAPVVALEEDPRMREYLDWVSSQGEVVRTETTTRRTTTERENSTGPPRTEAGVPKNPSRVKTSTTSRPGGSGGTPSTARRKTSSPAPASSPSGARAEGDVLELTEDLVVSSPEEVAEVVPEDDLEEVGGGRETFHDEEEPRQKSGCSIVLVLLLLGLGGLFFFTLIAGGLVYWFWFR